MYASLGYQEQREGEKQAKEKHRFYLMGGANEKCGFRICLTKTVFWVSCERGYGRV
jgi:hypothetical protein